MPRMMMMMMLQVVLMGGSAGAIGTEANCDLLAGLVLPSSSAHRLPP